MSHYYSISDRVCAFFFCQVWWDKENSLLPSIACLAAALNIAYTTFYTMDAGKFLPRVGYVYVAVLLAGFLHLKFFYNPIDVGQAKTEWKAKQAAKAAAAKSK